MDHFELAQDRRRVRGDERSRQVVDELSKRVQRVSPFLLLFEPAVSKTTHQLIPPIGSKRCPQHVAELGHSCDVPEDSLVRPLHHLVPVLEQVHPWRLWHLERHDGLASRVGGFLVMGGLSICV